MNDPWLARVPPTPSTPHWAQKIATKEEVENYATEAMVKEYVDKRRAELEGLVKFNQVGGCGWEGVLQSAPYTPPIHAIRYYHPLIAVTAGVTFTLFCTCNLLLFKWARTRAHAPPRPPHPHPLFKAVDEIFEKEGIELSEEEIKSEVDLRKRSYDVSNVPGGGCGVVWWWCGE